MSKTILLTPEQADTGFRGKTVREVVADRYAAAVVFTDGTSLAVENAAGTADTHLQLSRGADDVRSDPGVLESRIETYMERDYRAFPLGPWRDRENSMRECTFDDGRGRLPLVVVLDAPCGDVRIFRAVENVRTSALLAAPARA